MKGFFYSCKYSSYVSPIFAIKPLLTEPFQSLIKKLFAQHLQCTELTAMVYWYLRNWKTEEWCEAVLARVQIPTSSQPFSSHSQDIF